ncbi:MAG: hypothetical protein KGH67_04745 [Candidatus Micrarchaeota archaeon]|nr:hypothetical protein [Candidatus Micrarchaeota archaeon]
MESDIRDLVLQPYIIEILKELQSPKRFKDLEGKITTGQTLSVKLAHLKKAKLIEIVPIMVNNRYANGYKISKRGIKLMKALEKI